MARPSRFLRALAAATGSAALLVGVALAAAPAAGAQVSEPDPKPPTTNLAEKVAPATVTAKARKAAADDAALRDTSPLRVTMTGLAPSYLPESGNVVVRGQVTNRTETAWTNIRMYAFLGAKLPAMRTTASLAAAMTEPFDSIVGERIVGDGATGTVIPELGPGETASYVVRVPAGALRVPEGGVYWFGVHALGVSPTSPLEDTTADGRARTFMPYVPPRVQTPVQAALVLPLVRTLPYRSDGSIDFDARAVRSLTPGGRLRDLLSFASSAGATPLTWVVDPALVDGVAKLAAGNQARSLTPTTPPDDATAPPDDDAPTDDPGAEPLPETAASRAATAWLASLPDAVAGNEVLTLPYGNVDVPAAVQHDATLLEVARAKRSETLDDLGVRSSPVLTAPGGYLDPASIREADQGTRLLVTDRMFEAPAPAAARLDGRSMVVASSGAATGSPEPRVTAIGLRQRILAEAAVRAISTDQPPLTVVLPTEWGLTSPGEFFAGLDVDWLDLRTLSELSESTTPTPVTEDDVAYPASERRRELDDATFAAADALIGAGDTLQNVLGENFSVGGVVTQEALGGVSYTARADPTAARDAMDRSREWIEERLGQVTITAPTGITLSSTSGSFLVTVTNDLDEPVTVGVTAAAGDSEISVTAPDPVLLPPGSRSNVVLQVSTTSNRVHNVTLMVTDADGVPPGDSDQLPIRSAQVSNVIWLIMGSGVGLLFLAIVIRLVRRVRSARRGALPERVERVEAT